MVEQLIKIVKGKNINDTLIDNIINSGYIIRQWMDFQTPEGYKSVSDKMYGNKQFSSSSALLCIMHRASPLILIKPTRHTRVDPEFPSLETDARSTGCGTMG